MNVMRTNDLKVEVFEQLARLNDDAVLSEINDILHSYLDESNLTPQEAEDLDAGIKDIEAGRYVTLEHVKDNQAWRSGV